MAQVIRPEVWQEGIDDNRLLPGRYTTNIFTGKGVNIANNEDACRVWDIQVTDYITDYDDRRINGLIGPSHNEHGHDGWAASAYGVFQDVRFDSRVYTMGRHRSIAMRIYDEMQYSGEIGEWGTATTSNVLTNGQALMKTAQLLSRAKDIWQKQVLGPDIDKYNLFAILNGHISGRWVQTDPDQIFNDNGTWVAQPGTVQGAAIPPRFAPIHAIEWDDNNIPLLLSNIKVTWNNLFIPQENRVILIDPFYEYRLLCALTGGGVPATEAAYSDIQNGSFTRLMGWDFDFTIPSYYWPRLWLDDNLNVVHSEDADAAYDAILNSTNHDADGYDKKLMLELADADRMNRPNYVRTIWDPTDGIFKKVVTNYPLGMPTTVDYMGNAITIPNGINNYDATTNSEVYPWTYPGAGYGLPESMAAGPQLDGHGGKARRAQVIGCAVYRPAAQLSQEYSEMRTAEGETRGKFTEMVMDIKYDAWVIESLSHGILPIVDIEENTGTFGIPVKVIEPIPEEPEVEPTITGIEVDTPTVSIGIGEQASPVVTVEGTGDFNPGWTAFSSNSTIASVSPNGTITGVDAGTATITYRSAGNPQMTATVTVTVTSA